MAEPDRLICVRTFSNRLVAETARCALEREGIFSTISATDAGYDVALAQGGARLFVAAENVELAAQILGAVDAEIPANRSATQPIRFSLKALLSVATLTALALGGYVINGAMGAVCFFVSPIMATIGIQILASLEGRRPFQKTFVAVAGVGFLAGAIGYLLWGLLG